MTQIARGFLDLENEGTLQHTIAIDIKAKQQAKCCWVDYKEY